MSVVSISELVQFSASGVGGGVFEHKSNIPILFVQTQLSHILVGTPVASGPSWNFRKT